MSIRHTDEGKAHKEAHDADPQNVPKPPPVRADAGKGEPLKRDEMTWRDEKGNEIPFYKEDADGNREKDSLGRDKVNLTYDHDPPMVQRYNEEPDSGFNQNQQQRNDDFNDVDKLQPMGQRENSSKSGGAVDDGARRTYRRDTGPNFKPKGSQ